ncbi:DUF2206 domain-containing protein [Chloroflexota bacterium]
MILNPLRFHDWAIRKFLITVGVFQALLWIIIGLDHLGINIAVLRQIVSLTVLLFIPGAITLRILRIHTLNGIESLLFSVGISIAILMGSGAVINYFLPLFGLSEPLSLMPLAITSSIIVLCLVAISYFRDREYASPTFVDIKGVFSPSVLFLCTVPFLSIFGTYMVNVHHSNILLMVLIAVVAIVAIVIGFTRWIPKRHFPLAVFVIGLSLLFSRSLISMYITGSDIHEEYFVASSIISAGFWNTEIQTLLNSLLSITILAPVTSIISDISLTWLFKVIYPLLTALVPLGIYQASRRQIGDRPAFFSAFFFMSISHFYGGLAVLLRQEIASVFLVMLGILMVDEKMTFMKKALLGIVFGTAIVVSHYMLSVYYIGGIIFVFGAHYLLRQSWFRRGRNWLYIKLHIYQKSALRELPMLTKSGPMKYAVLFVIPFLVFAIAWYVFISDSAVFNVFIRIVTGVVTSIPDYLNPETSHGLDVVLRAPNPGLLHTFNAIINYLNQVFIIIGVVFVLVKFLHSPFKRGYTALAVLSLAVIAAGVVIPYASLRVDMQRLYHITLIFLSPFVIYGALTLFNIISRAVTCHWSSWKLRKGIKVAVFACASLYLAAFFLFESGMVWQLTETYYGSVSLSQEAIKASDDRLAKSNFYGNVTPVQDIYSAIWLSENKGYETRVYATYNDAQVHPLTSYALIYSVDPRDRVPILNSVIKETIPDAYIYLQYLNVVEGIGTEFDADALPGRTLTLFDMSDISHLVETRHKIYSNGGSEVYR